jgi:cell division transport system permease protein
MVAFVLGVTFLIAQLFVLLGVASDKIVEYFENQPQVTVFFKDEAQEDQILQIKTELEKNDYVVEVAYISKEQAVEIYRNQHQDDPDLLEFVTPDILPASIEISVNDLAYLSEVARQFNTNQFVENVYYQPDLIDELMAWTTSIRRAGVALLGVMAFVAAVIIILVIANNINMFGHEIEVMRLVGAGSWYVRMPFVLDGIIFALLGATLASGSLYWFIPQLETFIDRLIASVELFPDPQSLIIDLWLKTAALGSALAALVSYVSVWKYLKV